MSDAAGRVADATGNWVDTLAPAWTRPYLRLTRLDRPIGWWLLLIPCWWSSAMAAVADRAWGPSPWQILLLLVGAIVMRGAGCTWNDLVDRDIDARVERTRSRPIPSGQVSVSAAAAFLLAQAMVGLAVLLQFNTFTVWMGLASLAVVAIYPFMKRVTYWPQIALGLAFSWGALLLWVAKTDGIALAPVLLYAAGIMWTLHYDTIYAHQDREDDALIGVKSTARLFEDETEPMLWLFTGASVFLAALAVLTAHGGVLGLLGVAAFGAHLAWQIKTLDIDDPERCLILFRSNRTAGLLLLAGLVADAVF